MKIQQRSLHQKNRKLSYWAQVQRIDKELNSTIVACTQVLHWEVGYETVMINCNPETVSTDYDTSDRLFFEPLTEEDVKNILDAETESAELVEGRLPESL